MPRIEFNHDPIFPSPLLCCFVRATNSGKTYLLFHILTASEKSDGVRPAGLVDFNELVLFVPEISQMDPEYQFLKHGFERGLPPNTINALYHIYQKDKNLYPEDIEPLCQEAKNNTKNLREPINVLLSHKPNDEVFKNKNKTCIVLDDVLGENNQTFQQNLFQRGRHGNCCGFYLAQNFTKLDRNTVRENTTCYILFSQKGKALSHISNDIETKYEASELKSICRELWKKEYGYCYINCRARGENPQIYKDILNKIPY